MGGQERVDVASALDQGRQEAISQIPPITGTAPIRSVR
jgi:hypothetical protein